MKTAIEILGLAMILGGGLWAVFFSWIPLKRAMKNNENIKILKPFIHNLVSILLIIAGVVVVWLGTRQ